MFEEYTGEKQNAPQINEVELQDQVNSGANWFFWIAGLSLINSVISLFNGSWNFAIGLGITQIFDGIAQVVTQEGAGDWIKYVAFFFDLIVAGIFIGFGLFARKRHTWAFIVGMTIYAFDAILFILSFAVLGIIIHGLALFYLFMGLKAARELNHFFRNQSFTKSTPNL